MEVRLRAVTTVVATVLLAIGALAAIPAAPASTGSALVNATAAVPMPWAPLGLGSPGWAPPATAALRPGVLTTTAGGGLCTTNFVFTGGGRTYLGQAAHCAGTGPETEIDGCTSASGPLGSPVSIHATDGTVRTGTLAYSSWLTMQAGGERDPAACAANDFALVELSAADAVEVNPSVPFFGGPTGLQTGGLPVGAAVFGYGSALPRVGPQALTAPLRPKVGIGAGERPAVAAAPYGHEVHTVTPGVSGDSGAGYLTEQGRAVGLLATLTTDAGLVSDGITDLAAALAYANANGGIGEISLALGTEAFTTSPPGVPATALAPPAGPPIAG
jgi:hypothetical protein